MKERNTHEEAGRKIVKDGNDFAIGDDGGIGVG